MHASWKYKDKNLYWIYKTKKNHILDIQKMKKIKISLPKMSKSQRNTAEKGGEGGGWRGSEEGRGEGRKQ